MINNPFILYGYESEAYFCDRRQETERLLKLIENGNNVALIAPRRIGKTGLIENLYHLKQVQKDYYTFLIDIYATKTIEDMIMAMGSAMLSALRPKGAQMMQKFTDFLSSLKSGISFDPAGNPSWNVEIGDIRTPRATLDFSIISNRLTSPVLSLLTNFNPSLIILTSMQRHCFVPISSIAEMLTLSLQGLSVR